MADDIDVTVLPAHNSDGTVGRVDTTYELRGMRAKTVDTDSNYDEAYY